MKLKNRFFNLFTRVLFLIFMIFYSSFAFAADITISTDTTWTAGTYNYDNIIITSNSTLTVEGAVIINAVSVLIDTGSKISGNGTGEASGVGAGAGASWDGLNGRGAGHGGSGGVDFINSYPGGVVHGSSTEPVTLGSGGGFATTALGGAGGGAIRLIVSGTVTVDGTISANGTNGQTVSSTFGGGGAGGSIWITTAALAGAGTIIANGGNGAGTNQAGGGGGGRIAIYHSSTNSYSGSFSVAGGSSGLTGGNVGSFFMKDSVTNNVSCSSSVPFNFNFNPSDTGGSPYANFTLNSGCSLHLLSSLTATGNLTVNTGATITANGKGEPSGAGAGAGESADGLNGRGAGHGGSGGVDFINSYPGGVVHGSSTEPVTLGSGGGFATTALGGAGGGAIRLIVSGTVTVDGTISANGTNGQTVSSTFGGGGAGGSIWITTAAFAGAGTIIANGGNGAGTNQAGGGGGGRIAIYHSSTNSYSGSFSVAGGTGGLTGGNVGSFFMKNSTTNDVLCPSVSANFNPSDTGGSPYANFTLNSGCSLHLLSSLTATGNLTVNTGATITANGKGDFAYLGAGGGSSADSFNGTGAGHGGAGSADSVNLFTSGGVTHGSSTEPVTLGSGGGSATNALGGTGGGAIRLIVSGTVTVDGTISANGTNGQTVSSTFGGGGAGGSIWITTAALAGAGTITANGGNGAGTNQAGGGGGGRIAIYHSSTNSYSGSFSVAGGTGGLTGGNVGSFFMKNSTTNDVFCPSVSANFNPSDTGGSPYANFTLNSGCSLHLLSSLTATGNLTVNTGATITANGKGLVSDVGAGAGASSDSFNGTGAGHGGVGGADFINSYPGGVVHGSSTEPVTLGSGGGSATNALGGTGGGAIRLIVSGTVTVDGTISANGTNGQTVSSTFGGGGAGGSIWITTAAFAGAGTIIANGGNGAGTNQAGGGGGGRIAIYHSSTNSYSGSFSVAGGTGGLTGGNVGSFFMKNSTTDDVSCTSSVAFNSNFTPADLGSATINNFTMAPGCTQTFNGTLTVLGNMTVDSGATIFANGLGAATDQGLAPGGFAAVRGGGGGHAGVGADSTDADPGGNVYDTATAPTLVGSGGGTGGTADGGAGGGAIKILVSGTLTLNGSITADGLDGKTVSTNYGGGGSGGSIWLDTGSFEGTTGVLSVKGGNASGGAGGGGGGYIYVNYVVANTYSGTKVMTAGTGGIGSAAGIEGSSLSIATMLVFQSIPASSSAGDSLTPLVVAAQNSNGNTISTYTAPVTLTLWTVSDCTGSPTGGSWSTGSATTTSGVASFTGTTAYTKKGTYYMSATSGGLTVACSPAVVIGAAAPDPILSTATASLASVSADNTSTSTLTFTLRDTYNNLCDAVGFSVTSTGTGNTLSNLNPTTNGSGVATLTIRSSVAELKTIQISAPSTAAGVGTTVTFTVGGGTATQLAFTIQPPTTAHVVTMFTTFAVTVQTAGGATVTSDSSTVSLDAYTNAGCTTSAAGVLYGNSIAASSGVATFSTLRFTGSGTIYLKASDGALTTACSNAVNVINQGGIFRGF